MNANEAVRYLIDRVEDTITEFGWDMGSKDGEIADLIKRLAKENEALKETKKQLVESQRREKAAVEDIKAIAETSEELCNFCKYWKNSECDRPRRIKGFCFEWRGPQPEEGEEQK